MASSTYQQQQVGVPAKLPLPLDYTVRKHVFSLSGGDFTVEDAHGNLAFKVRGGSSSYFTGSATKQKQLFVLDASGNPLLSLYQKPGGFDWECCRRNWFGCEELVFRARKRQQASKWVKELEIYLGLESLDPKRCYCTGMSSTPWDMLVKGSPFARSCTIYKGNNILAQSSALHQLGKKVLWRHKFRLTFYCNIDHALVVALVAIFFNGINWK